MQKKKLRTINCVVYNRILYKNLHLASNWALHWSAVSLSSTSTVMNSFAALVVRERMYSIPRNTCLDVKLAGVFSSSLFSISNIDVWFVDSWSQPVFLLDNRNKLILPFPANVWLVFVFPSERQFLITSQLWCNLFYCWKWIPLEFCILAGLKPTAIAIPWCTAPQQGAVTK